MAIAYTISGTNPFPNLQFGARIVAGDFNFDGKLDVLYQNGAAGAPVTLAIGNGDGTFGVTYTQPAGGTFSGGPLAGISFNNIVSYSNTFVADLNGDGFSDVISVEAGAIPKVYLSNGSGYILRTDIFPTQQFTGRFVFGDFNNDGKIDVLNQSGNISGAGVTLYLNNGTGNFTPITKPDGAAFNTGPLAGINFTQITGATVHAVDLNGDGRTDIVDAQGSSGGTPVVPIIYQNTGSGFVPVATSLPAQPFSSRLVFGDFNGDGHTDVLTQTSDSNGAVSGGIVVSGSGIALYVNNHDGSFNFTPVLKPDGSAFTSGPFAGIDFTLLNHQTEVVGDFTGDGKVDLLDSQNMNSRFFAAHTLAPTIAAEGSSPNNGNIKAGASVDFTVTLSDPVTVTGGAPILQLTNGLVATYSGLTGSSTNTLSFRYTAQPGDSSADLKATALTLAAGTNIKDASGTDADLSGFSAIDTRNFVDAVAPTVNSVAVPANGTYKTGDTLSFIVNTSEPVTVTGTPQIDITVGSSVVHANYVSGSGSNALSFQTTVSSGQFDTDGVVLNNLVLNGGTIRDSVGNDAALTLNAVGSTAAVLVDGVAPTVTSITTATASPTNGTTLSETVTFSEAVVGVSPTSFSLSHTGTANGVIASITGSGTTYTVTLSGVAGDGTLRLDATGIGVTDAAGNALAHSFTSGAVTVVDHTAPAAPSVPNLAAGSDSGASSSDGITNVTTPTLTGAAEANSTVTLYDTDGSTTLGTTTATGAGAWSITSSTLSQGSHTLTAKAKDAAGNVSVASTGSTVVIDTSAPSVTFSSQGGTVSSSVLTVAGSVTDANVGSAITLTEGGAVLGTATVQPNGTWSTSVTLSGYSSHTIMASDTDLAGNVGSAQVTYTLAPPAPPSDPTVAGPVTIAPGQTQTFSGLTSGSLTIDGGGSLVLTGTNTYTGPTIVNAGTLVVDGSIVSPVTVNSGGTLGGHGSTGTVAVASGGTLSPGNSPGILSTKDLTLAAGSALKEELGGTASGQFDQVKVTGTVALNGATLALANYGFVSSRGDSFTIIDNDGTDAVTGTFANLFEGSSLSLGSHSYRISYHGGDGNDVVLTDVTLPVASTLMLFGSVQTIVTSQTAGVYALYQGLLNRAPDVFGLEGFSTSLQNGASLTDVANLLLSSSERGNAAIDPGAYVQSLYTNILHRQADSNGLQFFTNELSHGVSQATVAVQVATSVEAQAVIKPAFDAGVYVPDAIDSGVARLYYGLLGRAPDAIGLANFETQVKQAAATSGYVGALQGLTNVANAMLTSPEFTAAHAGQSNASYVDSLYVNALGRHADAGGASFFADQLAHGTSRATVALEISQSAEAQVHLVGVIQDGFHLVG